MIKKFLRDWNNLLTIPAFLVGWFVSPYLFRMVDPTAGAFDAGVLQIFVFAFLGLMVADLAAWFLIVLSWPTLHKYFDRFFTDFTSTTPNTRLACLLTVFALHFLGFVLLCRVM